MLGTFKFNFKLGINLDVAITVFFWSSVVIVVTMVTLGIPG